MSKLTFTSVAMGLVMLGVCLPSQANIIFFDDFDPLPADTVLGGTTADTGQTWGAGMWGGDLKVAPTYGQGGTNGVGNLTSFSGAHPVPLGQTLTSGDYTLSADLNQTSDTADNHQVFVMNAAMNETFTFKWVGGSFVWEGVFMGHDPTSVGFATGNLHVDLYVDLDSQTGSIMWYDIDDPSNAAHKGSVDLGAFLNPDAGGDGVFNFDQIAVFTLASTAGVDNVQLMEGMIPEPSTMALLIIVGMLLALRRRR